MERKRKGDPGSPLLGERHSLRLPPRELGREDKILDAVMLVQLGMETVRGAARALAVPRTSLQR